jgi:type IV pilus assembly protein PilV
MKQRSHQIDKRKTTRGLSMLEVMVALVILGIGILGTTAGQIAAIKLSTDSRIHGEAMYLAEQQLEVFKSMSGADVAALAGTTVDPGNPIDPDPNDTTTMALNRSWTITDDTPEVGMITIQVDVSWSNSLGAVTTASVQSLKANL